MTKKLVAKTGTYTNNQGETKGRYTNLGVMMSNNNGEYMLLDPSVNLAGVLAQQNAMNNEQRTSVMVSVFEDRPQGNPQPAQQNIDTDIPF